MRNIGRLAAVLLSVWGFFVAPVQAASGPDPAAAGRPAIRFYTSDSDGLPPNGIQALRVDRRGYLWAGTDGGAACYNGHHWTTIPFPKNVNGIKRNSVLAAADGSLWFGTDEGLYRFREGKWETFDTTNGLPGKSVYGVVETFEGDRSVIWCGVFGSGVCRLADGKWTVFSAANAPGIVSNEVLALLSTQGADGKWSVWLGTTAGMSRFVDGDWQRMDDKPKFLVPEEEKKMLLDNSVFCLAELHASDGRKAVYSGTPIGGVARWVDGKWSAFSTDTNMPESQVLALAETVGANGKYVLWAATRNGVWRYADGVWSNPWSSSLRGVTILSLAITDREGGQPSIWVGTSSKGLARVRDGGWMTLDEASGLPSNSVRCFIEAPGIGGESSFLMGGMEGSIQAFTQGKWETLRPPGQVFQSVLVAQFLRASALSGKPELLLSTSGHLMRLENGRIVTADSDPRLKVGFVDCVAEMTGPDGGKTLWAATIVALHRFDGVKWVKVEEPGAPPAAVRALLETADGAGGATAWVGSERAGLFLYRKGNWRNLTTKDGLPANQVNALLEGVGPNGESVVWVGTPGGMAVFDAASPEKPIPVSGDAALPTSAVYGLCRDRRGRIYATTNKGVARLTFRKPPTPDASSILVETFTTEDGLPSNECSGQPYLDSKGRIWVGTGAGAAIFNPENEASEGGAKPLFIERVALGEKGTAVGADAALGYDDNDPVFSFALLSYFREKETRFRTELAGYDKRPTDWTAESRRAFSNLPERDFTFRVWARDYAGNVSGPVEFRFRVVPPLWRRWWAYLLYFGIVGAGIVGGVRMRIRTLANQNRLLEQRVSERTTELAEAVAKLQTANEGAERKNRELDEKIGELEASQQQADRIFSALAEALPGTVLDEKYRLDEKIGSGGFGAVFRATHLALNRPIAVKVFKPVPGNDSVNAVERFRLEGVSVARLNHRNIVSVIDSGISREGIAYLVMELLQGHSLYEEVSRKRPLPLRRCLQVLVPVCHALAEAHAKGIVHRDIKPSNIFLHRTDEGEVVKVVDFGTAKLLDTSGNEEFDRLTLSGSLIGTPNYFAPERIAGKPYDGRSDVYGVGIIFYQMLCGRVPFLPNQGNAMNILVSHLNTPPPLPSMFNAGIAPEVEAVALLALEKSPESRPTAEEFAAELETLWEFVGEEDLNGSSDGWFPVEDDGEAVFPTLGNFSNFENAPATQKYSGREDDQASEPTTAGIPPTRSSNDQWPSVSSQ